MPATEDPHTPDERFEADPEVEDFLVRSPV